MDSTTYIKVDQDSARLQAEALALLEKVEVKGHDNLSNLFNAMSAINLSLQLIAQANSEEEGEGGETHGSNEL